MIAVASDRIYTRRRELYRRSAPVFRRHGYRGSTLKALAHACGISIPALYRYFPSKRAFALFPLISLYPELHPPGPDVGTGEASSHLLFWVEAAAREAPNYHLAMRLAQETGFRSEEERKLDANLAGHIQLMSSVVRRAAPHLDDRAADELASSMVDLAIAPAFRRADIDPSVLRRELRRLLRGYGISLPPPQGHPG